MVQSVTAFGRLMIEQTKQHVEEMFTIKNGYAHDAKVCNRFQFVYSEYSFVTCVGPLSMIYLLKLLLCSSLKISYYKSLRKQCI